MLKTKSLFWIFFFLPFLAHCGASSSSDFEITTVVLQSIIGSTTVFAEVADTEEKREEGLSGRLSLSDSSGMLFVFDEPDVYTFTMQDTYLSLDIIFISENKLVIDFEENTTALALTPITPNNEILYALEVSAGFVEANGVQVGDTVVF
jgi:uncharacterized membrane protein (UPF0127 family)